MAFWDEFKWNFSKAKDASAAAREVRVDAVAEKMGKPLGSAAGDVLGSTGKGISKISSPVFKTAKWGAIIGTAAVALGIATRGMRRRNTVAAPNASADLDFGSTSALGSAVPAGPMLPPLDAQPTPTLMGEVPREGEWVNRMGRGGRIQDEPDRASQPPNLDSALAFQDVSTTPSRA